MTAEARAIAALPYTWDSTVDWKEDGGIAVTFTRVSSNLLDPGHTSRVCRPHWFCQPETTGDRCSLSVKSELFTVQFFPRAHRGIEE